MTVPARNPNQRCPRCRAWRLRDAPRDCTRCGMEEAEQLGWKVYNLTEMSAWFEQDRWIEVGLHFDKGWIMHSGFYVYVADHGGRLSLPRVALLGAQPESSLGFSSMTLAALAAANAAASYCCVWALTSLGGWEIADTDC